MESILTSIKKMIGITEEDTAFDTDIIININMAFNILNQIGVGPDDGFQIEDKTAVWSDFIEDHRKFNMVKTYIYLKVKKVFDPGSSSSLMQAMDEEIKQLEWRLNIQAETGDK